MSIFQTKKIKSKIKTGTDEIFIRELAISKVQTFEDLGRAKRKISGKYGILHPTNIDLLKAYHKMAGAGKIEKSEKLERLLVTRPIRSLSGIVNISVLTKPYPCPGKCIFCPQESGIPKSYVSGEPAVERAKSLSYNPFLQVNQRLEVLGMEGHATDKVELRLVGGTFSFYPKAYQKWFIKRCFDACNKKGSKNLLRAQKLNEVAKHRIVGISIETRPDFINEKEIKLLRELGVTMVELGVQSIYESVLKLNSRSHEVKEIVSATKILKDSGFKVLYQMMPNLYGSDIKNDEKMFEELFLNPDFQPDLLKIYPCALMANTKLFMLWQKKKYKPYSEIQLTGLLEKIKQKIPYFVRIQRITRDIPSSKIVEGPAKISNLRQLLSEKMREGGLTCKCIRCREAKDRYDPKEKLFLFRQDYRASQGREIFLSFEDGSRKKLFSLLRLRIPSQVFTKEKHYLKILQDSAIIREIHTYGQSVPLEEKTNASAQHRGLGKKLILEAEKIAKKEFKLKKLAVISGIGARGYYRKSGYREKDGYMAKDL